MTGTRIEQWPWAGGPEVDWLRGSGVCGADPVGVVTAGGRDLVVLGPLDDWRSSDGNLGCGGVLLGGEGPILVVWDKSGVRVLPSGCPALPWLVVEPEGELAEILAALIRAVPSQWCQESSEDLPESQGSVTPPRIPSGPVPIYRSRFRKEPRQNTCWSSVVEAAVSSCANVLASVMTGGRTPLIWRPSTAFPRGLAYRRVGMV